MKIILPTILALSLSLSAFAEGESRTYKKKSSTEASVEIDLSKDDGVQAAAYADGAEVGRFLQDLLNDEDSELFKIKQKLIAENCGDEVEVETCGSVEVTDHVQTSFGRGGWMEAEGAYTAFIGFRFSGTGHFFSSSYMVTVYEDAVAQTDDEFEFSGKVHKSLSLSAVKKLD
jgi:hypothetical protein